MEGGQVIELEKLMGKTVTNATWSLGGHIVLEFSDGTAISILHCGHITEWGAITCGLELKWKP